MLLKKELTEIKNFMLKEGKSLELPKEDMDKITTESETTIKFNFPSQTSQLELIRLVTTKVAGWLPEFIEEDLDDIGLAMDEACTNVIRHSYLEGQQGVIIVEIKLTSNKLIITIIDKGEKGHSFNLDALSDVDKEEYLNTLSRGGLGVHIIKKIMDEVEYTVSPGNRNCLKMTKYVN